MEQLRLKPGPDEETLAKRKAASARRDVAQAGKAAVKKANAHAAAQAKARAKGKAAAPDPTEADRKAARDARYAARRARNNR